MLLDIKVNDLRPTQLKAMVALVGLRVVHVPSYPGLGLHFPREGEAYIYPS